MQQSSPSPRLVAWRGLLYRVGGLSFDDIIGEAAAYHSLDVFEQFDPQSKTWTALPAVPSPRPSLDAAVVDVRVHVVGGWSSLPSPASH